MILAMKSVLRIANYRVPVRARYTNRATKTREITQEKRFLPDAVRYSAVGFDVHKSVQRGDVVERAFDLVIDV